MKCPNDGAVLTMSERSGVEIDYCPECRGVWLDRGELDKILDRATADTPAARGPDFRQSYRGDTRHTRRLLPGIPAAEEEGELALRALRLTGQPRRRALA